MGDLILRQLFEKETSSYTYILADSQTKEAVVIDPVVEMADRDEKLLKELGLKLKYILDTHVHADHITASGELRKRLGARVCISEKYGMSCPDIHLGDGQEISFGKHTIKALATPGHTSGCMSYVVEDMVFTGDALLIRGCGRTDFQEGSSDKLYHSVRDKLFSLPPGTKVYPAHDYRGFSQSSIEEEKQHNARLRLQLNKDDFIQIMDNLNLAYPKKIQEAVPANMLCGMPMMSDKLNSGFLQGIPTVTPEELAKKLGHARVIDVRQKQEFNNELGHIPASELATLGEELERRLEQEDPEEDIVFVCRVGARSASAVQIALAKGFRKVFNLYGGMERWNELNLPVERDMGGS